MITLGIVVVAAAVVLRLALGRTITKHLRQHYGTHLADEMVRHTNSPSARIAAQAALPIWLRLVGRMTYLALPIGVVVIIIGIVG